MEVIVERPAALDVHNASVTACARACARGCNAHARMISPLRQPSTLRTNADAIMCIGR
jgi:hypothetical protein